MDNLTSNKNYETIKFKNEINKNENYKYIKKFKLKYFYYFIIIIIFLYYLIFKFIKKSYKEYKNDENNKNINFEKYEINVYNKIKSKKLIKCSRMWSQQREFLNGVIRKFRPKKLIEIGVAEGGSSIVILNAIKDIKNSHLYSIDLSTHDMIGSCVKNFFSYLNNSWSLFTGNIPAKFIEKIGRNIDMAIIDSGHYEPGEILDFLIILPFLKEEAIVIFHDIGNQITKSGQKNTRRNWAPYIIFNIIRGTKFYQSGKNILTKDIGAIKLEKNQFKYIHDYFRALGGQWEYFLEENHIKLIRNLIKKFYDKDCSIIFEEAIKFNRKFVKNNPVKIRYIYDSHSKKTFFKKK